MHLLSSLIAFFAFTLSTSINALPIPVELSNGRDISVVVVHNNNNNHSGLPEHHTSARGLSTWTQGAAELKSDNSADAAPTSSKGNSMEVLAITGPTPGGPDWRRHSDSPPYTMPSL